MHQLFYNDLIKRYLQGQLADKEYETLIDFLKDKKNLNYFNEVKSNWNLHPEMDEKLIENWERFQFRLFSKSEASFNQPFQKLWIKISRVAAILIIGIIIGDLIFSFYPRNSQFNQQLVFETRRGEKSHVILPDGTNVWLNAKTKLIYHSFTKSQRIVELKGEAFFAVAHFKKIPFIVKTNECNIEVLGTTFNVMAYDEFGKKEVTLLEGKVKVNIDDVQKILNPGQVLILKNHNTIIKKTNPTVSSGWVNNKLNFYNIPLSELIKRLENWYDVDIILENPTGKEINFTGAFKNEETIWEVLDAIKYYTHIQYEKTNLRKIKISLK
jgi:transmembrane sensor